MSGVEDGIGLIYLKVVGGQIRVCPPPNYSESQSVIFNTIQEGLSEKR